MILELYFQRLFATYMGFLNKSRKSFPTFLPARSGNSVIPLVNILVHKIVKQIRAGWSGGKTSAW